MSFLYIGTKKNCNNIFSYFESAIVIFNWVHFALIIFGLAIVFDPLGSTKYKKGKDNNDNGPTESALHRKLSSLWLRRFRWVFCCLRKDEFGNEAFSQVAQLLAALFRGTDLVPSDIMAGCVLLRVRQKRETREMRRIRMLNDDGKILIFYLFILNF